MTAEDNMDECYSQTIEQKKPDTRVYIQCVIHLRKLKKQAKLFYDVISHNSACLWGKGRQ